MSVSCHSAGARSPEFAGKSVGARCAYWPRCMHSSGTTSFARVAWRRDHHRLIWTAFALALGACGGGDKAKPADETPSSGEKAPEASAAATLTLGAYSTPREAYGKAILPAFAKLW